MKKFYSLILLAAALICLPSTVKATTPFTEGFETAVPPTGWSTIHVKGGNWSRNNTTYYVGIHGGSYDAMMAYATSGGADNYLITPQLSPVDGETLKFYIASQNYENTTVTVEVSETTNTSASDFTDVLATYKSKIDINTTWAEKELSLGAYAGKNIYIAFHVVDNNGANIYLDDVSILAPITCPIPTNLTAGNISVNSAEFTWTKGGDETEWLYLCVEADAAQDWSSATKLTSPSVTVDGLTGTTDYKFHLRALCGEGDTSTVVTKSFSTPCATISALPWTEGFESMEIGNYASVAPAACWDKIGAIQTNVYSYPQIYVNNSSDWVQTGSKSLYFISSNSSDSYVILPSFEAVLNTLQVTFSHKEENTSSSGQITFGYITDISDATSFVEIKACDRVLSWKKEEISLADAPAINARLAFKLGKATNNYYTAIDDIIVELIPSCVKPNNIVALPTPEGAVISWEQGKEENEYEYACDVTGFTPSSWETVTSEGRTITVDGKMAGETYDFYLRSNCGTDGTSQAVKVSFTPECGAPSNVTTTALTAHEATIEWDAAALITQHQFVCVRQGGTPVWDEVVAQAVTSVTLDTLQAATSYDFYVRSYYSDGVQSTATKLTFTTNCDAVAIGWNEKFDAATMPNCWTAINASNGKWAIYNYDDESYSGYSMRFAAKSGYSATLQTPALDISEKALLKFYWKNSNALPVTLQISTDGGNTKVTVSDDLSKTQTSLEQQSIDLSAYAGETVILYFTASGNSSSTRYAYIDEMTLEYKPAAAPTNLTAAPTADGAVITWNNDEEGPWDLRYKEAEASEWTEVNGLTQKTYTLTGLSAEKSYDVQVRANCSANRQSAWTSSITFAPTCPTPSTIEFSNQTYNGATVTWAAGGGESMWNLRYKNADDADWTEVSNLTERTYNLENLTTGKEYTVEVQASCNGEWASAVYTPAFVAPTFASEEITDVTATISWNDVDGATSYKYAFVPKDDAVDWSSATQTGNAYAEISDLQALTEYDFYVKTMYTSGESEDAHKTFTTIAIAPNNLTLDDVQATSATFSWAKNGSAARQYQVVIAEGSAAPDWANATLTETDVLTATIDNLTPNTYYTFYVRAYYEADKVSDAVSNAFETPCAAVSSFPWEEDFESVTAKTVPACWDKSASTATPAWDDESYIWTVYLHNAGSNNLLCLNNSMVNADGDAVISTPTFEIPISPAYDLTFSYAHTASCGEFAVLVSVDGGAFSNFTEPKSYGKTSESGSTSAPDGLTNAVISLADYAGKAVAFQFSATPDYNTGAIFIDNVKVAEHVNEETAISNTGSETKAVKAIENGQLIIIREGVKYNAQGAKL